ncbi:MAG TPA: lysophospholipid acyltransferase family protein [Chloroflexota bacterium]
MAEATLLSVGWFPHVARVVGAALLRLVVGVEVIGAGNVPPDGPLLVVANHRHWLDPVVIYCFFPRTVAFMAKAELFRHPLIRWILQGTLAFPVRRDGGDMNALRRALGILARGGVVGMFPEGTRSRSAALRPPYPGAGFLVARSRAPVVPVALVGTEEGLLGRRSPVRMIIGRSWCLAEGAGGAPEDISRILMDRVAELLHAPALDRYREG